MADITSTPQSSLPSSDIRQRRPIATSQFHDTDTPTTATSNNEQTPTPFFWTPYTTRWEYLRRHEASFPKRALMRLAEICALAFAIRIITWSYQILVVSIDETWETTGRRARSPFSSPSVSNILFGVSALVVYHGVLALVSYKTADGLSGGASGAATTKAREEEEVEGEMKVRRARKDDQAWGWGRILGKIVIPTYLALSLVYYFYHLVLQLRSPKLIASASSKESESNLTL